MDTIQRFIIAGALGLVTLQVFSFLFGQYFSFDLHSFGAQHATTKPAYLPLYAGQSTRLVALSTEGIQGGAGVQGVQSV